MIFGHWISVGTYVYEDTYIRIATKKILKRKNISIILFLPYKIEHISANKLYTYSQKFKLLI